MRTCTKCNKEFPATLEFFHKQKGGEFGLNSFCKECKNKKNKQWREDNPEYQKQWCEENKASKAEYQKQWTEDNQDKRRANEAKRRALKKGATVREPFAPQDVLDKWGTDCHICKNPIDLLDWHMEHVVALSNGGEHSLKNVKPSHPKCNMSKGTK